MTRRSLLAGLAALLAAPELADAAEPGRWRRGPDLGAPAHAHRVVALADGTALILRPTLTGDPNALWERVRPGTGHAEVVSNRARLDPGFDAIPLPDGRAFAVGGPASPGASGTALAFDAVRGDWEDLPEPAPGIGGFDNQVRLAMLPGARVLVVSSGFESEAHAAVFDLGSRRWEPVEAPRGLREGARLARLGDGRVLRVGAISTNPETFIDPEIQVFDPASGEWGVLGTLPSGLRYGPVVEAGSAVVMLGGVMGARIAADGSVTAFHSGRVQVAATGTPEGTIILAGGVSLRGGAVPRAVEALDPATNACVRLSLLPTPSFDGTLTRLAGGALLLTGGSPRRAGPHRPWSAGTWLFE